MTTTRSRAAWVFAAISLLAPAVSAAIFDVDSTEDGSDDLPGDGTCSVAALQGGCSLRAALEECAALAGPDEIRLGPGEHRLRAPRPEILDELRIVGAGEATVINGLPLPSPGAAQPPRLFVEDLTLRFLPAGALSDAHLSLTRVSALGSWLSVGDGASLTLLDGVSWLIQISVEAGGVLTATDWGLGSANLEPGSLLDVSGGECALERCGVGGNPLGPGISVSAGRLEARDSVIADNQNEVYCGTTGGGGLAVTGGEARLERCVIRGNELLARCDQPTSPLAPGGGVYAGPGSNVVLESCTLADNTATASLHRAAMRPEWLIPEVSEGGGAWGGTLINCTVVDNVASTTTPFELERYSDGRAGGAHGSVLVNSIVAGNEARDQAPDCERISLDGPSLIGDSTDCSWTGDPAGVLFDVDPQLQRRDAGHGPRPAYLPAVGSPVVDAGDSGRCPLDDQLGLSRPRGLACDLGAIELCAPDEPDGDADGIADDCDVCPFTPDPEQGDLDGDRLGDACDEDQDGDGRLDGEDCAPRDAEFWSRPGPPLLLPRRSRATSFFVRWSPPAEAGGRLLSYDALASSRAWDFTDGPAGATCIASGTRSTSASDPEGQLDLRYYLVRARNGCGTSPDGGRVLRACP